VRNKRIPDLEILAFAFTNRCNLACTHCVYDHLNRPGQSELPLDFFVQCLAEGRPLGAHSANITGGEVFLRPDILDLVAAGVDMGYFMSLESNGTLITDADIERLKSFGDRVRIAISLDGMTTAVHEAIRGPNTYDRTIAVLKKLSQAGVPCRINTALQTVNIAEVPKIAAFAVDELGIGFRLLPYILDSGKGACVCQTDGIEYSRIVELTEGFLYPFIRQHPQANITIGLNVALVPIDIEGHLLCPWAQSMIGIGPTGIASLCHVTNRFPDFIFGDLTKESLADIWTKNEQLKKFRSFNPDTLKGVCGNCQAREICRGGCRLDAYLSFGDILAPDGQCQAVYNMGMFPDYALNDPEQNCRYE